MGAASSLLCLPNFATVRINDGLREPDDFHVLQVRIPKGSVCINELIIVDRTIPSSVGARLDGIGNCEIRREDRLVEKVGEANRPSEGTDIFR